MPILVDAFECLLPSPALLKKHVPSLEKATRSTFDWGRLNDLATFLRTRGGRDSSQKITRAAFRSLMEDFFGFHDEKLTGQLFDVMDADKSGIIDFKELMQGLSMRANALEAAPHHASPWRFCQLPWCMQVAPAVVSKDPVRSRLSGAHTRPATLRRTGGEQRPDSDSRTGARGA